MYIKSIYQLEIKCEASPSFSITSLYNLSRFSTHVSPTPCIFFTILRAAFMAHICFSASLSTNPWFETQLQLVFSLTLKVSTFLWREDSIFRDYYSSYEPQKKPRIFSRPQKKIRTFFPTTKKLIFARPQFHIKIQFSPKVLIRFFWKLVHLTFVPWGYFYEKKSRKTSLSR